LGWKKINESLVAEGHAPIKSQLALEVLCMIFGVFTGYNALFATGFWIYGQTNGAIISSFLTIIGAVVLFRAFEKIKLN